MRLTLNCLLTLSSLALSQVDLRAETTADVTPLLDAANAFLSTLDESQKKVAQLSFDSADREDWHYVPKKRKGLA